MVFLFMKKFTIMFFIIKFQDGQRWVWTTVCAAKPDSPEFNPQDTNGERRELIPANCPLIFTHVIACVHPHTCIQ